MAHNIRCENANPDSKCRCSCGGRFHGIANRSDDEGRFIRSINASLGGEIARTLDIFRGVRFKCTCGQEQEIWDWKGYPHANGLEDDNGERWWIFIECTKCNYQWSWHKLANRVKQQNKS